MASNLHAVADSPVEVATFVELLRDRAIRLGESRAFTFLPDGEMEGDRLTYGELDQRGRAIAAILQSFQARGERALLLYPPGLEFIAGFFGCLYAGAIAVPVYPPRRNQKLSRLEAIVKDARAKFVLTTRSLQADIVRRFDDSPELAAMHWVATDTIPSDRASDWHDPDIDGDTLAFLQYTSGSTGTPKGVMVTHANLLDNSADLDRGWKHTPESVLVTWLPTFHDMGLIYGALQPIYKRLPCYMMAPLSFLQRPLRWLRAISRYRGTHSGGPNFAYDLCVRRTSPEQRQNLDLSCWQMALNGAEPVCAQTLAQFAEAFEPAGFRSSAFCPGYGLAEFTLKVAAVEADLAPKLLSVDSNALTDGRIVEASDRDSGRQTLVGCGWSHGGSRIVIVDPQTSLPCPRDRVGEIWVAGSSLARGYWNRPAATQQTFRARLKDTGDGPFLRTGDLGFVRDGELFVTGRIKDVMIIRGRNYYPQDIELTAQQSNSALRSNAGAAFTVEISGEERLIVVQEVERTALRHLNIKEIVGDIRQAVAQQHELQVYRVLLLKTATIPKTSSGKIQRHACRNGFLTNRLEVVGKG
jgi:acyl-CoA synthetase (AMP-forming)/AMP-acid ligase II